MTIPPTTFERCARSALHATLSATLLAACGGGDPGFEAHARRLRSGMTRPSLQLFQPVK